jgi:hypothetical protein
MKCIRKPTEFEFMRWDGNNNSAVGRLGGEIRMAANECCEMQSYLFNKYGRQLIDVGDYVVRDAGDGLEVLSPARFGRRYEEVLE